MSMLVENTYNIQCGELSDVGCTSNWFWIFLPLLSPPRSCCASRARDYSRQGCLQLLAGILNFGELHHIGLDRGGGGVAFDHVLQCCILQLAAVDEGLLTVFVVLFKLILNILSLNKRTII